MKSHYSCEQVLATAAFAVEKSAPIVMGAPLILYAEHAVFAIIQKAKTTLTTQRVSGYEIILSLPSLKVVKCHIVNPATFFAHPISDTDDDAHDCATDTLDECSQATDDLIPGSVVYFVDGSSTTDQDTGVRHTGAAMVRAMQTNSSDTLQIIEKITLPSQYSAQAAEVVALVAALKQGEGETMTVYSDSAYATMTVNSSIMRWNRRVFLKSDRSSVMHRPLLEDLIQTFTLPHTVAVVKCVAHNNGQDFVSRGNALADWAAKDAATRPLSDTHTKVLLASETLTPSDPLNTSRHYIETAHLHIGEIQENASEHEKQLWEARGCTQTGTDLIYRQMSTGKPVMPYVLLLIALNLLHLPSHTARDNGPNYNPGSKSRFPPCRRPPTYRCVRRIPLQVLQPRSRNPPQYRHPHKSATPKVSNKLAIPKPTLSRQQEYAHIITTHESTQRSFNRGPLPNVTGQEVPDISSPPTEEAHSDDSSSARLDQDDQPGPSGTSGQSVPLTQSQTTTEPLHSGNTTTAPTQRAHPSVPRTRQSAVCAPLQGTQATPLTQDNQGPGGSGSGHTVQGTEAHDNREAGRTAVRLGEDWPREPTLHEALSNIMGAYHHSQGTMGMVLAKFQETQRLQDKHYLGIREDLKSINTTLVTSAGVLADLLNTRRDTVAHQWAPDTSLDDEQPSTSAGTSGQEAPPQDQHATSTPPPADGEPPRKWSLRSRNKTENIAKAPARK
ncbi:hypothetical protein NDU88_000026 [Pleurodeles waltl]|uniref:RNase H type-1 domain-containing protein n=1 Tax=Pleurodeles waltl TaxID=8319 RepID=A0AAV7KND2_PLEWA|nr:hypothetical protein NDU88_000026 [Pleurodeles waltl]